MLFMKINQSNYSRLIAIFFLGVLLFTYPILSLFDYPRMMFGVPLLFLYLFCVWSGLIFLIYLVMRVPSNSHKPTILPDSGAPRKGQ